MPKKLKILEENWKRIGKVWIVRDEFGGIRAWKKASKDFTKHKAYLMYSARKSFDEHTRKRFLQRIIETAKQVTVSKEGKIQKRPHTPPGKNQYMFYANVKGKILAGRSESWPKKEKTLQWLREEAWDRFIRVVAGAIAGVSDPEVGEQILRKEKPDIEEYVVYYKKRARPSSSTRRPQRRHTR